MDASDIYHEEALIIAEMNGNNIPRSSVASGISDKLKSVSRLQKHSDTQKLKMIRGDRSVSMADITKADAEATVAFSTSSMLVKKVSEGVKTILGTTL